MSKIIPLGKNILIKLIEVEKVTKSGIILPGNSNDEKSKQGEIIAVGDSKEINAKLKPKVKVVFDRYEGSEIEIDKDKFVIIKSKNVLAVVA